MALEYSLYLQCSESPAEVLDFLFNIGIGLEQQTPGTLTGRGLLITGIRATPPHTVGLLFRLDKFESTNAARRTVIRSANRLLHNAGAGVLLFNWELPLLRRENGVLFVNSTPGIWQQHEVAGLLTPPFTLEPMPVE